MTVEDANKLRVLKRRRTTEELIAAAQAADKKRDKSRKTLTKEEQAELELLLMLDSELEEIEEKLAEEHFKELKHDPNKEWDVKKGDPIYYFDPTLSYELTGYRPITATEGLDFDPKLFTEAADSFRANGRYTMYMPGTFKNVQFWDREWERCTKGLTIGKYTLTGRNYFWLNYYRLESSISDKLTGEKMRTEDFPGFIAKQYEYFHYLELCKILKRDACVFKARGVGASEIAANNECVDYTFEAESLNITTAFLEDYVTNTLNKVWAQFDFLNTNTDGAFRHVRHKFDQAMHKRASKVDKDKNESGWKSEIIGITHDHPRKLRGFRANGIVFEEAGSDPVLETTYTQAEALVRVGGKRVGTRLVQGTGGESGPSLAGLNKMFNNPEAYKILPYKHNYTQDGQTAYTGYFIPAYTMWFGDDEGNIGFDSRGVVYEDLAKQHFIKEFNKIKDPHLLLVTKAEFCFTPEDAFILEGSNRFDQELLVSLLQAITMHKTVEGPKSITLHWKNDSNTGNADKNSRPTVEFVSQGPLKISELPKVDSAGNPYSGLYVAGCLTPGEKVQTISGLKNCEDITLDDKLYSIYGDPVNIINLLLYYKEDEDIYTVKLNNIFRTTTFTKEHPIYCATEKKKYHNSNVAHRDNLPYTYYTYDFGFKKMSEVKVGDFVKVPNIYQKEKPIPYNKWDESNVRIDRRVGNHLSDRDFWWLMGLLLGDGWAESKGYRVNVVFNKSEKDYINKCKSIVNRLFHKNLCLSKDRTSALEYSINCQYLNLFFSENFGRGAKNKHIPEWIKFLPANLKLNLVLGYLASDGCVCPSRDSLSFVSCSYLLLEDVQDILFSLGIISTVHWLRSTEKEYIIHGRTKLSKINKAWTLDVHGEMINKFKRMVPYQDLKLDKWQYKEYTNHTIHRCFFEDETCKYIYIKISSIEHSKYTGIVYNYHCETSTFMCKYIPTHNCDAIDTDSTTSTGQTDVSEFCVVVMRRAFGSEPPKVVAVYKERPQHITTAFDTALKICSFYNCQMLVEATRISIKLYFEKEHKLHYMMRRPLATANTSKRTNFRQYGVPATEAVIDHYLDLIELYIIDYALEIQFPDMLEELIKYSYAAKRKFDIVAALGMTLLADEEYLGRIARPSDAATKLFTLTYVKNEWGQMEFKQVENKPYEKQLWTIAGRLGPY